MAVEVFPMLEEDVPAWCAIHYAAFGEFGIVGSVFYSRPLSEASKKQFAQDRLKSFQNGDAARHFKAVDTATGEILGCAKWWVYREERPQEEVEKDFLPPTLLPENNGPATLAFWDALHDAQWRTLGTKPSIKLDSLTVSPAHQGKGVGRKLVRWGTELADRENLVCYLESTSRGIHLYKKMGFEPVEMLRYDPKDYGVDVDDPHVVMLRQPNKASASS